MKVYSSKDSFKNPQKCEHCGSEEFYGKGKKTICSSCGEERE